MYIRSREGLGEKELSFGRGLGYFAETGDPRSRWHLLIKDTIPCPPVKILIDGKEIFSEMAKAIRSANPSANPKLHHYIYVLGWMLQTDFRLVPNDPNSTFEDLLKNAVSRGVQVRVMVWNNFFYKDAVQKAKRAIHNPPKSVFILDNRTYGTHAMAILIKTVQSYMSQVEYIIKSAATGATLLKSVAMGPVPAALTPVTMPKSWQEAFDYVRNAPANQGSHHEKVLLVKGEDGLIGFCGGADINCNRLHDLHEVHCRVKGHAAWQLLRRFITRWEVHPDTSQYNKLWGTIDGKLWGKGEREPPAYAGGPRNYVKVIHTYNHWNGKAHLRNRSIQETIFAAISNAKRSIYMEDQYMVNLKVARLLNETLIKRPQLKLTIIIQSDCHTNDIMFPTSKREWFLRTLMAGVSPDKVGIKMIRPAKNYSAVYHERAVRFSVLPYPCPDTIRVPAIHEQVHSKVIVIDDEVAIIGSANCNRRSLTWDSETSVVIIDPVVAKNLRERLDHDLQGNLVTYLPGAPARSIDPYCEDLDKKVMGDRVFQVAAKLSNVVRGISSLLPEIWKGLWEIVDPQAPV